MAVTVKEDTMARGRPRERGGRESLTVVNLIRINFGPPGQRPYAAQDANHNVTALIDTGTAVVERYEYDPYGKARR